MKALLRSIRQGACFFDAASYFCHIKVIKVFNSPETIHKALVFKTTAGSLTCLHIASQNRHIEVIETLLQAGAPFQDQVTAH